MPECDDGLAMFAAGARDLNVQQSHKHLRETQNKCRRANDSGSVF